MKHTQMDNNTINSIIHTILETQWAIGATITADAVLITYKLSMTFDYD